MINLLSVLQLLVPSNDGIIEFDHVSRAFVPVRSYFSRLKGERA